MLSWLFDESVLQFESRSDVRTKALAPKLVVRQADVIQANVLKDSCPCSFRVKEGEKCMSIVTTCLSLLRDRSGTLRTMKPMEWSALQKRHRRFPLKHLHLADRIRKCRCNASGLVLVGVAGWWVPDDAPTENERVVSVRVWEFRKSEWQKKVVAWSWIDLKSRSQGSNPGCRHERANH